ncbi:hypothetical protein QBC40DRAFT_324289 [Triangularia verruculosa]|uniref:SET domain-containing protein n=1 Tax=Triangularia verruculosa TaxID=2587418 RepID=A0AAN6XL31_9PEZI|nr:hypothetical protein QBC40DRAFT_324289 [Triangularia verruculosa]
MSENRKRKHPANDPVIKRAKSHKTPKPTRPSPTPSSTTTTLPKNWPPDIPYLTTPSYSPQLSPSQLSALKIPDADLPSIPESFPSSPATHVRITKITDPTHPAFGQSGLFATAHLPPGTLILPYLGEYHPGSGPGLKDGEYDYSRSDYDLWLDRDADVAVDAARCGNEARFVNDYRGVPFTPPLVPIPGQKVPKQQKTKPNAEFRVAWDVQRQERVMSVWVLPSGKKGLFQGIQKGEEVLVSYGRGFWEGRREVEGREEEKVG